MRNNMYLLSDEVCFLGIEISKELDKARYYDISKQLRKSSTSIGANLREAQFAESKKDFIHKLSIALKECNETLYWLRTIEKCSIIEHPHLKTTYNNCYKIMKLLHASITTTKNNISN